MKIFNNFKIPKNYREASIAIGNFDGVHIGHQRVFKLAKKFSRIKKSSSVSI